MKVQDVLTRMAGNSTYDQACAMCVLLESNGFTTVVQPSKEQWERLEKTVINLAPKKLAEVLQTNFKSPIPEPVAPTPELEPVVSKALTDILIEQVSLLRSIRFAVWLLFWVPIVAGIIVTLVRAH